LAGKKLLQFSDAMVASSHFNWLVMADPVNLVMMLGYAAIPTNQQIYRHADAAVATFLAASCSKALPMTSSARAGPRA
ncbi:TetR/AcrR family transcriptional regulator C-terminal domain-containing protein, partial [Rhizobium johnstonii]